MDYASELVLVMVEMIPSLEYKSVAEIEILTNWDHFSLGKADILLAINVFVAVRIIGG